MKLINPNEIGAKISTLIAELEKKFYAVTTFINCLISEEAVKPHSLKYDCMRCFKVCKLESPLVVKLV